MDAREKSESPRRRRGARATATSRNMRVSKRFPPKEAPLEA